MSTVPLERMRMDKWLWAVRIYRTRSRAAAAYRAGHVRIRGEAVKPARGIVPGEIVTATVGRITRTVRAVELVERRVGAGILDRYLEDLTPAPLPAGDGVPLIGYRKGQGRPTKRDRRDLERVEEQLRSES